MEDPFNTNICRFPQTLTAITPAAFSYIRCKMYFLKPIPIKQPLCAMTHGQNVRPRELKDSSSEECKLGPHIRASTHVIAFFVLQQPRFEPK